MVRQRSECPLGATLAGQLLANRKKGQAVLKPVPFSFPCQRPAAIVVCSSVSKLTITVLLGLLIAFTGASGEDIPASQLLLVAKTQDIQPFLPKGTYLLHDPV